MKCGNASRLSVALLCLAATTALTACAGFPPTAADMADVPVVRFGQPAPADKNFVMFYPEGAPLPVKATVKGTLLKRSDEKMLEVSTVRDIYIYREWVSFDGKEWLRGDQVNSGRIEVLLPGGNGTDPGVLSVTFDAKTEPGK